MKLKLAFFVVIFVFTSAYTQETEVNNSILFSPNKLQKHEVSSIQLSIDPKPDGLYDGLYSLEKITPGLFLRPESFMFDSPILKSFSTGFNFKYYLGNSDLYLLGGMQSIISAPIDSSKFYNFGLNGGVGYDVNDKMQIEASSFYSLYNTSPDDAFEPVQLIPLQPLSLGFKTKF